MKKKNSSFVKTTFQLLLTATVLFCSPPVYSRQSTIDGYNRNIVTSLSFGGHKKIILQKNIVNGVNTLTQSMINRANTTYVINYDFVLGEKIAIPDNCELRFEGGSLKGNHIVFCKTLLSGNYNVNCGIGGILANERLDYKGFEGCNLIELCAAIKNCSLNLKGYTFSLTKDLVINGGTRIVGGTITTTAKIKNEGGYSNNAFGANRSDLNRELNKKAVKGTNSLVLASVVGLEAGDYIKIGNGYQSLWKVLETPGARDKWLLDGITGWDYQIATIKSIQGNRIIIDTPLESNYPVMAIATGLIKKEELGKAFVCKIGQVKDIILDGCCITGDLVFVNCDNLTIKNCSITSYSKRAILLGTCINSRIINNKVKSEGYAISLESQTYNTIVDGNYCVSNGATDACILTMLGVSKCRIANNKVVQNNKSKIGIYLNTSKDNYVINNNIFDGYEAIRSGYSYGGAVIKGNKANNCSVYWFNHARNDIAINNSLTNYRKSSNVANGLQLSYSKNIIIDGLKTDVDQEQSRITGVVDCTIRNCKLNTLYVLKPNEVIGFDFNSTKGFEIEKTSFRGLLISDGGKQEKVFKNCSFSSKCIIGYNADTGHNKFFNCSFTNLRGVAVEIMSANNTFHNCVFKGSTQDIIQKGEAVSTHPQSTAVLNDFEGSKFVHGNK